MIVTNVTEIHRKPDFLTNNSTPNVIEKARVVDQNGKIGAETKYLKEWKLEQLENQN